MLTAQHYEAIAEIIAQEHAKGNAESKITTETIAFKLAVYFKHDNPSFDREKFMYACGMGG